MASAERVLVVAGKPLRDYLINVALLFQEGASIVVLKGYGRFISKAVDLYNIVALKMKESIELVDVSIGTEVFQGRSKPYIAIRIQRKY